MRSSSLKTMTLLAALAVILIGALLVAGCTSTSDGPATTTPASGTTVPTDGAASGRLSVTGSTTVLPVAQALAERFMELNPNADIQISGGGSSVGITSVGEGTAEIGMSSRDLKEAERSKYPALRPVAIARDGIVMIVNPSNTVPALTIEQVRDIYAGTVTNWQQVGGADRPIVPIGRDSAAGTREVFTEKIMGTTNTTPTMLEKNSNGAIQSSVAPNPSAIGYVGLGYVDATVRAVDLSVNGTAVAPTIGNVVGGQYPLARELSFVTNGEATGLAQEFIAFALGDEGQGIVEDEGFVSVTA
jgi:phosphate transport system substrate-binding protein